MPSTSLIAITPDMLFDLNGRKGKTITRLFDGDLLTKIDASGTGEDAFVLPYRSMIVLPNIYGNMKFEVWESFGSGGTFTVRLYNEAKTLLGTYSKAKSAFNSWQVNNPATVSSAPTNGLTMEQHTTVRFIEIYLPTVGDLNIGDFETRLYGDVTGAADSIYPGTAVSPRTDPGAYAHGMNYIDDRYQQYLQGSPGTILSLLMSRSARVGYAGPTWNFYPDTYTDPLVDSPLYLGRHGDDFMKNRLLDFAKTHNHKVQVYHVGGSLKNLTEEQAEGSNNIYIPNIAPINDFKYIEPGADPEDPASWDGLAEMFYKLAALYGTNASADMTGQTITNGDTTPGQGGINILEVGNEWNRDWATAVPYHSPRVYYTALKRVHDRVKQADPNMLVFSAAVTFMDTTFWRAMYFWHYWLNGLTPFPCDGINMNLYLNSDLDGQGQSGDSTGLNPEAWGLLPRLQDLKELFDLIFPNKYLHITENAYAANPGSPYDVVAIGAKTARQVAADISMRTKAVAQLVPSLIDAFYYYAFFEDGSGSFDSMGATAMTFGGGGSYTGNTVYPSGYVLANELFIEQDYEWWAEIITNGGTIGPWITVKNHPTDPLKKLFKVWRGTMNGSSALVAVPVGANATDATLYTLDYADFEPNSAPALISGTNVNVVATEGMQWLEVTYDTPGNIPPVADAGVDQAITLPTSQVTVNGSGSTDSDGTITTYAWTKISGPATFTITSPSSVSTTITGLVEGTYVFRLTVTDNDTDTDTDDITITVNPANVPPTAAAGSDQVITLPTTSASVNGSGSTDSDGTIVTYLWSKMSGPVAFTITNPNNASTTITDLVEGIYVFRLTVTDDDGATDTDDIQITVEDAPGNVSPTANAGDGQTISLPINFVTVDGSASSDPDGTIDTYLWTKVSGPATYTITSPSTAITTITGLVAGTYIFRLTVTDNDGAEDADDISITVNALPSSNRRRWFTGWWKRNIFRRG